MRNRTIHIAIMAGTFLACFAASAMGPGRPPFDEGVAVHRGLPGSMDPCGPHRPIAGICRMLRPVRG